MGFAQYIRTREGRVSCGIVLASAVVLAIFLLRTLVDPIARQYRLNFGSARWIQMPGAKPLQSGYFRGTLYIPGPVTRAWLQVSATGSYKLYVNDVYLDWNSFACVRPSGVYDLKQILALGKNVIAVYVPAGQFPGPAQVLVRGSYTVAGSDTREFVSNLSWKVSSTSDGIINSYPWTSQALIDTTWRNVVYGDPDERFSTVQPLPFDPRVIEAVPFAKWIGTGDYARQASFVRHLHLPWRRGETWLQVAATGAYDVTINGVSVASQPEAAQTDLVGPEAPQFIVPGTALTQSQMAKPVIPSSIVAGALTPSFTLPPQQNAAPPVEPDLLSLRGTSSAPDTADSADMWSMPDLTDIASPLQQPVAELVPYPTSFDTNGTAPLLTAYNVTRWMTAGDNVIQIRVYRRYGPATLFAQGYTYVKGAPVAFSTDEHWRTIAARPGATSPEQGHALVVADYGTMPWGPLPEVLANPQSLPGQNFRLFLRYFTTILGLVAVLGLLWLCTPRLIAEFQGYDTAPLWTADALLHLPLLCGLLFLWMLSFDARIRADWCFIPPVLIGAAVYLVASKLLLLFSPEPAAASSGPTSSPPRVRTRHYWCVAALTVIVLLGLAIRAAGLLDASLAQDETTLILASWGILKVGFPYVQAGSFTKWLATYELVPYPLALSSLIFGTTPFAYRLPALLFGTATIGIIGWVGYRMMGWRVGLVSALIYACLPMPILWARDGFYPSQQTCFALLTFWFFYEAIRDRGLNGRLVTLVGVTFILTDFSWEGSAFIMVALFLAIFILKWGEYDWMLDGHLWRVFGTVTALVIIQLCYREWITVPDYLGVVVNLSQISTPSLAFLNHLLFSPYFYLECELFVENHFVLTLLTLIGMPIAWRSRPLLYLYISLAALYISYTGFLAHSAPRYGFFWTPLLVLAGVGSFFFIWESIAELPVSETVVAAIRWAGLYGVLAMLILAPNPFMLKLYRLSLDGSSLHYFCRLGAEFKPNYHGAADYISEHDAAGDVIVTDGPGPHVYFFYTGRWPTASMNSTLDNRIIYDAGIRTTPLFADKIGMPLVKNMDQLLLATAQTRRVWIMTGNTDTAQVRSFIRSRGRYVFESSGQAVFMMWGAGPPAKSVHLSP
jgi:4-amino-4-deoxy-L-arabinose transferase-like glycosyltransferase